MKDKFKIVFPLREYKGRHWCSLDFMGIKKLEIVSFDSRVTDNQYSFIGGHRHRYTVVRNSIHLLFPEDKGETVDISGLQPATAPALPVRRQRGR